MVINDVYVRVAVVIKIYETSCESCTPKHGLVQKMRYVGEGAVMVITVEAVASLGIIFWLAFRFTRPVCDVKVYEAVVIVITPCSCSSFASVSYTSGMRNVFEAATLFVV